MSEFKIIGQEGNYEDFIDGIVSILNSSSYKVIKCPLKSFVEVFSSNSLENDFIRDSGLSCAILNQITENILSLGYCSGSVKSESPVTNILCSDLESDANFSSEDLLVAFITSNPFVFRNDNNLSLTFSSNKNLRLEGDAELDIISSPHEISSILEGCFNVFLCDGGDKGIHYFFDEDSSLKHFKNLPNHNPSAFESRLTMTDFCICNNVFVNFNSHSFGMDIELFKDFVRRQDE